MFPTTCPAHIKQETVDKVLTLMDGNDVMYGIIGDKFVQIQSPMNCDAIIAYQSLGPRCPSIKLQEIALNNQTAVGVIFAGTRFINPEPDSPLIWFGNNVPKCEYVGRDYLYGIHDCLSLVRDFYIQELGIYFDDTIREYDWWLNGSGQMKQGYEARGFYLVKNPRPNDVVLMCCPGMDEPTHVGVLLQDAQMLHHLADRYSEQTGIRVLERAGFRIYGYLRNDNYQ